MCKKRRRKSVVIEVEVSQQRWQGLQFEADLLNGAFGGDVRPEDLVAYDIEHPPSSGERSRGCTGGRR